MTGETPPAAKGVTEAATALVNFAWSLVVTDCTESAEYLNELVDNLRVALRDVPGQASEEIPEGWAGDGLRSFLAEKAGRAALSLPAPDDIETVLRDFSRKLVMSQSDTEPEIAEALHGNRSEMYRTFDHALQPAPREGAAELIARMQDAIEGECEGLAIDDGQAIAILEHVGYPSTPSSGGLAVRALLEAIRAEYSGKASDLRNDDNTRRGYAWAAHALSRALSSLDRTTLTTAEGEKA